MSKPEISIGLDYTVTPDLQACLKEALCTNYSFIVSPVVHPRFRRNVSAGNIGGFTRSDMILGPKDWTTRIVGKLSPYLDVDVPSPIARQRNEDGLNEELTYCRGLGLPAIMLSIHGRETINLARILQSYLESSQHLSYIWTKVPMVCHKTLRQSTETDIDNEEAWNETWHWWSKFHERLEFDKRVGVVLEISADLPSQQLINRWLGEPIKAVMIPTSIFENNKRGFPVLSQPHKQLIISMLERDAQLIICGAPRATLEHYWRYMQKIWTKRPNQLNNPMLTYARGWEDYLQTPLQPLADNLDTHTYNVFEKDPVKYEQYQNAIAQALIDIQKKEKSISESENIENHNHDVGQVDCENKPVTVMILGAGRGPLVRATFNAADITKTQVKVIAVEKNPCAVVVLTAQVREVWRERDVTIVPGDMRQLNISPKADIIVSELLGSWGDNELSPECLDGAAGLLKADGISIPKKYTSYVAPISSARLWAAAKTAPIAPNSLYNRDKNLETLWVVYMQNKHDIAEPQPLFTFEHPAEGVKDHEGEVKVDFRGLPITDNRRTMTVTWKVTQDNILHGFGGYFDCSLYGNEMISILPSTHSPSMISWFPVFIPIKTPMRVEKGEEIKATFWRCVSPRRVWYEWIVEVGNRTSTLHNSNGRSSEMLL